MSSYPRTSCLSYACSCLGFSNCSAFSSHMKRTKGRLLKKPTSDAALDDPSREYGMGYVFVDETPSAADAEDGFETASDGGAGGVAGDSDGDDGEEAEEAGSDVEGDANEDGEEAGSPEGQQPYVLFQCPPRPPPPSALLSLLHCTYAPSVMQARSRSPSRSSSRRGPIGRRPDCRYASLHSGSCHGIHLCGIALHSVSFRSAGLLCFDPCPPTYQ